MRPDPRDEAYIRDMRAAAVEVTEFVSGMTFVEFEVDTRTRRAVERGIFVIGEAASHVSKDLKGASPEIPWRAIVGMRNILGHEYGDVKIERLWRVAVNRIGELTAMTDALLARPSDDSDLAEA